MAVIRFMIADEHSILREALKQLLESDSNFPVIEEEKDGVECLHILSEQKPDVFIVDLSIPNKNGLEVLKTLNKKLDSYKSDLDKIGALTNRELDVLKNLAVGMCNKEISIKLDISERTVKNHISSIFKKIGVSDRTQAAVFAIRNYLVDIYK